MDDTPADLISDETGISKFVFNCNFENPNNIRDNSSCENLYVGVLINNMMALPVGCSRTTFTTGQISRMKLFLDDRLASINNTIPVVVANKFNGGVIPNSEIKPSTLKIDATDYNSGSTVYLIEDGYSGKTNQERFVNYQSNNIKHHDWNNISSDYHLLENFTPSQLEDYRYANFFTLNYAKIEVDLEGQLITGKGAGQFQDPWYVLSNGSQPGTNHWIDFTSVYEPTGKEGASEKGIFLNQDPTFDPTIPNYSVKVAQTQDIPLTNTGNPSGRTHRFYFQNWGGTDVQFQNSHNLETGLVFQDNLQGVDPVAQANLKGTNLTNSADGYYSTSQRTFVTSNDGYLHSVYESMGSVWYETSKDNGISWIIQNEGEPIAVVGKNPAIDYGYYYDPQNDETYYQTLVVWQEPYSTYSKIKIAYYYRTSESPNNGIMTRMETEEIGNSSGSYSSTYCTPVVSYDLGNLFYVVYKNGNPGKLYCRRGLVNTDNGITVYGTLPTQLATSLYAKNPSIVVSKTGSTTSHVAWEEPGIVNTTDIKYATLSGYSLAGTTNISTGDGYPVNYSPSISLTNGKPVVSWTAFWDGNIWKVSGETGNLYRKKAMVRVKSTSGWGSFAELGDDVNYANNNSVTSSAEKTVIVWSQGTTPVSKWTKRTGGSFSEPVNLSHSGIQNQVSSGSDYNTMTSMVFNNQQTPYYFIKSTSDFSVNQDEGGELNKITLSDSSITYGRSGIVNKNSVEFVFNIGDVFAGDSTIRFIEVPDTIQVTSTVDMNNLVRTENFMLDENAEFFFSNLYYVIRQELADSVLTELDQVNFKVELVKGQTGEVIGTFDNITYNKYNLEKYANINYQVNC